MKIRNGFVSNSSSSSFILAYGIIKNDAKLKQYLKENSIEYSIESDSYSNVKVFSSYLFKKQSRILSCTNHTELLIPKDLEYASKNIIVVEIGNNEGDSAFTDFDDDLSWEAADDINFYSKTQQAIIRLFYNEDIINTNQSEVIFGAERNG